MWKPDGTKTGGFVEFPVLHVSAELISVQGSVVLLHPMCGTATLRADERVSVLISSLTLFTEPPF